MTLLVLLAVAGAKTAPLPAHSHNDYWRDRPLRSALEAHFASVEADVFLQEDEIRVGHEVNELKPGVSLERLYLDPLAAAPPPYPLILMVDIKAAKALDTDETMLARLNRILPRYSRILTRWENGKRVPGRVTVVLSGARPVEETKGLAVRYFGLDGRLDDLRRPEFDPELMPMVSDNWFATFRWASSGPLPPEKEAQMTSLSALARERGALLRFWGAPDQESVWAQQLRAGVGLIGTDRPAEFSRFMRARTSGRSHPKA